MCFVGTGTRVACRDEDSPQESGLSRGAKSLRCHRIRRVGQTRGKWEVGSWEHTLDLERVPPSASIQMYCKAKRVSLGTIAGLWLLVGLLLTSAMILPFWGSSRYLASCLWGHTCQSRVIPAAGHFLLAVVLVVWSCPVWEIQIRSG